MRATICHTSKLLIRIIALAIFLFLPLHGFAQSDSTQAEQVRNQLQSLERVLTSINTVRKARDQKIIEIREQQSAARQERLAEQLDELNHKLNTLEEDFLGISSGIETDSFSDQSKQQVEWTKELEDLLSPLFQEVRRLTSRPRELARLRSDVEKFTQQIALIDQAITNINHILPETTDTNLLEELKSSQATWLERQSELRTQLSVASHRLDQLERAKKSFSESVSDIFEIFFRSRGRNLVVALLVAVLFGLLFRALHRRFEIRARHGKGRGSLPHRLFNVFSLVASTAGAFLVFLITLYFFGDWVLLILGILFLLGIIWTSKHAIPTFLNQALLLLNVGPVREGERVSINGVPWHVKRIGLYSEFENPLLTRRHMRLPISDLKNMRSQPGELEEPWFPTRKGDWIILADGTYGRVREQSDEFVVVLPLGGTHKYYSTANFIANSPQVLSNGFRISFSFGLDYGLQSEITTKVPAALKEQITKGLATNGYAQALKQLNVEFAEAGPSSLNIAILADFSGEVADRYTKLQRLLHSLCVDACNVHGWTIPFPQLTVHLPKAVQLPKAMN